MEFIPPNTTAQLWHLQGGHSVMYLPITGPLNIRKRLAL